jgi:hypothetical protein
MVNFLEFHQIFLEYGFFRNVMPSTDYSGLLGMDIRWSANLRTGRAHFRDRVKHHGNRRTMERLIKP